MVLGTAQFGMDYGITNVSGKPSKKEIFGILNLAWEKGVRRFDTAPSYGSEMLLGEFIVANSLRNEAKVLTKISSLEESSNYKQSIMDSLESSLKNLTCPVDVLFFHNPADSDLLLKDPQFFENLMRDYPVSTLGVSVYEPQEVEHLSGSEFELAFQFPLNVLDRRFEQVNMPDGKRYARSVFLQGLLASKNSLRQDAHKSLHYLQNQYHNKLAKYQFNPVNFAVSFVGINDSVDYLLFGVETAKQLHDILNLKPYDQKEMDIGDSLQINIDQKWYDPKKWT